MQAKERSKDLCCVLSASIPSSDPGERVQREKGEMFPLQFLCLICNRPISLATVPAGQLTSGGTLLKLRRAGRKTCAASLGQPSLSFKVSDCHTWTASKDINFSHMLCWCYLFVAIWYFSIWDLWGGVSASNLWLSWTLYIHKQSRIKRREKKRNHI